MKLNKLMTKTKTYILFLILFNISLFAKEQTKDEILWLQNMRPPWMINTGLYKNQGYGDLIRIHFQNKLDEYKHKELPTNPSRMLLELKKHDNICYGPLARVKPFEKHFHWSKPIYALAQPVIIVLESTFKKLGSPIELSMEELIKNKEFKFGHFKNINLYPIGLKPYLSQRNVYSVSTNATTTNLLNMLQKKRIDWIVDSSIFLKWHMNYAGFKINENFKTINIKEAKDKPSLIVHITCKKNEFGKKIIEKINQNISNKTILEIREIIKKWQFDEENTIEFEKINKSFFKI